MDSTVTPTPPEFPHDLGAARPGRDAMADSDLGVIRSSLGKRAGSTRAAPAPRSGQTAPNR
jgi:hypothetical protein